MIPKIIFTVFVVGIFSCAPFQNQAPNAETNTPAEIEAKKIAGSQMMQAGYLPGRIIYSDLRDDCQYTIQLKENEKEFYYVDPINLNSEFNTDGQTVWVKFTGLKRENRCEKAVPVELTEILNRDE